MALPTTATIRLPSTGPLVQKPMAVARPTCGEKSRISAGVATRQMPSTMPTANVSMANAHLLVAAGRMKPDEDRGDQQAEDHQVGAAPPVGEPGEQRAECPEQVPNARVTTKKVKVMCRLASISVATEPPTYSS